MADKKTGFMTIEKKSYGHRKVEERVKDFKSVYIPLSEEEMVLQANRCMDCGTSFCNWGCPLGNYIPEWNDLVFRGEWEKAYEKLSLTTNFPEFTGRVCPALCEAACVMGVNREAVSVREIEQTIAEMGFEKGWVKPKLPEKRTGKKVAVIGAGPAGLAVADDLNELGHNVTVYEREKNPGGLLRYGIPNYKLEKQIIDRRIDIMKKSEIEFITDVEVGTDIEFEKIEKEFDAVVCTTGTWKPRDINIPGRELEGIYFAVDYLSQQTKKLFGEETAGNDVNAKGKTVLVIGGGDTGADCVGTANRQGASKVVQFEIMPKPSITRDETMPWPTFPRLLKITTSHEEGCENLWEVDTKEFIGENGKLKGIKAVRVKWEKSDDGRWQMSRIPGSEFEIAIDMALIAVGFLHTEHEQFIEKLNIDTDNRGNVAANSDYMTSRRKVFCAGDMRTGQSLVVKAILDGKEAAKKVHYFLKSN